MRPKVPRVPHFSAFHYTGDVFTFGKHGEGQLGRSAEGDGGGARSTCMYMYLFAGLVFLAAFKQLLLDGDEIWEQYKPTAPLKSP